uniref:Uncharacterized protein n=1 Tax=Caenorhabditis japonica TaxID=281687 RepID=A0A8R1ILN3_CAEJA
MNRLLFELRTAFRQGLDQLFFKHWYVFSSNIGSTALWNSGFLSQIGSTTFGLLEIITSTIGSTAFATLKSFSS